MRVHQAKNRIGHMHNNEGVLVENYDKVKAIILEYYEKFFAARSISANHKESLCKVVNDREIESVMLNMKKGTAPGLDGFSVEFYRDAWATVKESVVEAMQTFFATSVMPRYVNNTTISLIPKV
ncbi:hypothetical protein LIER_04836 [Lithospermum erythrorhizon]|uniref:Reverse transcriptase n=1 Tax=Lithospermum erythrorhizon TaxID=34254 RepID=A0AAV3NYG1_LITER